MLHENVTSTIEFVATPLWPSVGVKPNTSKVGDFIGKVLKRKYQKWPRIGHLNIFRPSYGQKKGWESNWQFDSRPLKVENRPLFDL
jgi:hypothetical protein